MCFKIVLTYILYIHILTLHRLLSVLSKLVVLHVGSNEEGCMYHDGCLYMFVDVCVCACIICHFLSLRILTAHFKESKYYMLLFFFGKNEEFCPKSDRNLTVL